MVRTTKLITISIMPDFLEEVERVAREENRTKSELIREALRRYLEAREWRRLARHGRRQARKSDWQEENLERLLDDQRGNKANG